MREIIKKKYAKKIQTNEFMIVDMNTGELVNDAINERANKKSIQYNFIKMNTDCKNVLIELLGYNDYLYFLDLCMNISKYGSVDVCLLDNYLNKEVRMRKIRLFKKHNLIKRIRIKELKKSYYYINPYVCHKTKEVWVELANHFKPIYSKEA